MNTTEAIKEHERRLAVMRAHAEGRAIHDHELYAVLNAALAKAGAL